jgi:hypothetical protein
VVHHEVGDDPDPTAVRVVEQQNKIVGGPEIGVDRREIADVVATVAHR